MSKTYGMPPNKPAKQWIVRDADGKIYGPFSSEQVLIQIDKYYFVGSEQVAIYPGGNWINISKSPEFSDRLLDVLAAEGSGGRGKIPPPPSDVPEFTTRVKTSQTPPTKGATTGFGTKTDNLHSLTDPNAPLRISAPDELTRTMFSPIIELEDVKSLERAEKAKQARLPLIIISVALIVAVVAYLFADDRSASSGRIHLLMPRRAEPEISEAKQKEKYRKALEGLVLDTYSGYQRAQGELVEIIEGASRRSEDQMKKASALSALCLVYRELWPFAYQDSQDTKAVALITQEAKRIDPAGINGATCEITQLMLNNRYRDAQGLAESILLEQTQAPALYEIRGDIFFYNQDYSNAAEYFKIARSLWPAWRKGYVQEARARARLQQYPTALTLYDEVIHNSRNHGVAKIEMGIIEGTVFSQYDKGISLINSGLNDSDRIPRPIQSRGNLGLAQLYFAKNQVKRALEFAKLAYGLNAGNVEAKQLIVKLAGEKEVPTNFKAEELVALGDQYVRAGDCFSAQAQFKAAFDADNRNAFAALKAGKCLWQLNQSAEAMDWLRKAMYADPNLIAAYVELANYSAQRFDFFAAAEVLKRAQARSPKSFEVYRGFAEVEFLRHNYEGAAGYGLRALKLYETDMDTILLMTKAYIGLQNYPEAQRFASRAIDLDSNDIEAQSLYGKIEAGLHGVDAGAHYMQGLINRFVITKGQQVPQAAIDYRTALGEIYMQDERYKAAEEILREAIGLDRNNKKALMTLGKIMQAESYNQAALELFLRAAVLDPSDADPIYYSGQLYLDAGKIQEAARQYERVLKINMRYPKGHVQLGRTYLRLGNSKKALEEALAERAINPELVDSYLLAAESYFNLQQYGNCAGEYQKAVSKQGPGSAVLVRMSRCYRLSGALDSATSLLREAVTLESGNPDIYKEQGAIYHMKGMADEAIKNYDTYLRLAPNATDRAEVESRIRRVQAGDMNVGDAPK